MPTPKQNSLTYYKVMLMEMHTLENARTTSFSRSLRNDICEVAYQQMMTDSNLLLKSQVLKALTRAWISNFCCAVIT